MVILKGAFLTVCPVSFLKLGDTNEIYVFVYLNIYLVKEDLVVQCSKPLRPSGYPCVTRGLLANNRKLKNAPNTSIFQ